MTPPDVLSGSTGDDSVNREPLTPAQRYEAIAETLLGGRGAVHSQSVSESKGTFGSTALTINGKIFVMLVKSQLVLKLPRLRVDELIDSGHGERFGAGRGRPLKEWIAVEPSTDVDCLALAREAMAFVAPRDGNGAG